MRRFIAPVVLLFATALGWQLGGATRTSPDSFGAKEAVRLRSHFATVEREMLARDLTRLTLAQRVARAELLALLRRYSDEGAFPRNDFHPGRMVPYFRDARGNLCAMAFLIAATGRGDIVDHVARTRNNAYVPELADEPGLAGWLEANGITLEEAARIQPSYDDGTCCFVPDDPPPIRNPSTGYLMISAGGTALSAASIAMNARSADRLSAGRGWGFLGLGVGAATMALGAVKVGSGGADNQVVGAWNLAVGATAAFFGGRALSKRHQAASRAAERLRIAPVALAGPRPAVGFVGRLQF